MTMDITRTLSDLYIQEWNEKANVSSKWKQYILFILKTISILKNIWLMFQNFIIPKLSNIGLVTIGSQLRLDDGMIYHYMSESVKFALQTTLVMSIIICLHETFLRVTENCFWNRIFMLSQIYASIWSFLPQPMKQRSFNYQELLQLLWKRFLCRLFFQMIEIIMFQFIWRLIIYSLLSRVSFLSLIIFQIQ